MRWAEVFYASSGRLLERVLKVAGIEDEPLELLYFYLVEGVDPNVKRKRLLDPWVQTGNFQENNLH
ncbi:hypothetical protein [Moorella sulfitireducens (nom. illeg.)]|uniref:hypothetical protein n=1 Tax=Neomoorella sulfitireducens TaxID=2972948 RepID=UPI0021AC5860|nr:hypothetical protein [Moorella sulfitireducens]